MLIICQPDNQPADFALLAQHMTTFDCCGYSNAAEGYDVVDDIPAGYEQRCLPPQYGKYLNLQQIATAQVLEQRGLQQLRADADYLAIMTGVDL